MTFQVKIVQNGRGGTIFYAENSAELSFDWEFSMTGATVFVPNDTQWKDFCKTRNFADAIERRNEILENLGKELCRQQTSNGSFDVFDNWIEITL